MFSCIRKTSLNEHRHLKTLSKCCIRFQLVIVGTEIVQLEMISLQAKQFPVLKILMKCVDAIAFHIKLQ